MNSVIIWGNVSSTYRVKLPNAAHTCTLIYSPPINILASGLSLMFKHVCKMSKKNLYCTCTPEIQTQLIFFIIHILNPILFLSLCSFIRSFIHSSVRSSVSHTSLIFYKALESSRRMIQKVLVEGSSRLQQVLEGFKMVLGLHLSSL